MVQFCFRRLSEQAFRFLSLCHSICARRRVSKAARVHGISLKNKASGSSSQCADGSRRTMNALWRRPYGTRRFLTSAYLHPTVNRNLTGRCGADQACGPEAPRPAVKAVFGDTRRQIL